VEQESQHFRLKLGIPKKKADEDAVAEQAAASEVIDDPKGRAAPSLLGMAAGSGAAAGLPG
jgi:hypothetical protein